MMKNFKLKTIYIFIITIIAITIFGMPVFASNTDGTIDSTYKYAWGENIGWINFGCDNCNVHITDSGLSGYALSKTIGWIYLDDIVNDGEGNLSGYAWSENGGYIKFNPTNGGVIINSSGEWTGSALGENIGWIIFDNCDYQVKTDWRGQSVRPACNNSFDDDGDGLIDYPNDPGCDSLTDNNETDPASSGGGGLPPGAYNPPTPPSNSFSISIQDNAKYANNRVVTLKLNGGSDVEKIAISNTGDFSDASQEDYQVEKEWDLCLKLSGLVKFSDCSEGIHTVYVKFYTKYGQPSQAVSDTIILDTIAPEIKITKNKNYYSSAEDVILSGTTEIEAKILLKWDEKYGTTQADGWGKWKINLGKMPVGNYQLELIPTDLAGNNGNSFTVSLIVNQTKKQVEENFINEIPKIENKIDQEKTDQEKIDIIPKENFIKEKTAIEKIIDILDPIIPEILKPDKQEFPKETVSIPEQAPLAMQGKYDLLSKTAVKKFVLAPLPHDLKSLTEKFPQLKETFEKLDVNKASDIEKIKNIKLILPGLTKVIGLPKESLAVAQFSKQEKEKIPKEIIFAKTAGEMIDFNINLIIDEQGVTNQKIFTLNNKPLNLIFKPSSKAKAVKGYLAFTENKNKEVGIKKSEDNKLFNSFSFIKTSFAKEQTEPSKIEEKLVLLEFDYEDTDKDGIWTAEIIAPVVNGEYEIITVIEYEDSNLKSKAVKLIMVVDPEGYIYRTEKDGMKTRISDAEVSLYQMNQTTKQYEIWSAKEYQQKNPQITDDTGNYSFLVPLGTYYLKVEHPNYSVYQSEIFVVKEGSGIHINIELKTKYWWLKIVDWKIITMIVFGILLFYNFYRDRIRKYK